MAACSSLLSPVLAHATTTIASSSSSGDEGSTRLQRRWSVNGGGQDGAHSSAAIVDHVLTVFALLVLSG